jgi:hypothetical protein
MWGKLFGDFIIAEKYTYAFVIERRPDFKAEIDAYLTEQGREDLIV